MKNKIANRALKAKEISEKKYALVKVMHEIIMVYKLVNCWLFGRRT